VTAWSSTPLREWQPALQEQVRRWNVPGTTGTVLDVIQLGHFADPYWRVSVSWDDGLVEHAVETSCLVRPDGSQGQR
jgi:hypothetical protein